MIGLFYDNFDSAHSLCKCWYIGVRRRSSSSKGVFDTNRKIFKVNYWDSLSITHSLANTNLLLFGSKVWTSRVSMKNFFGRQYIVLVMLSCVSQKSFGRSWFMTMCLIETLLSFLCCVQSDLQNHLARCIDAYYKDWGLRTCVRRFATSWSPWLETVGFVLVFPFLAILLFWLGLKLVRK